MSTSLKNPELELAFWRSMKKFGEELRADPSLKEKIYGDPIPYLKERGLDAVIPVGEESMMLSEYIARLDRFERAAVIDSLVAVSEVPDIGRVAVVTPVANANAGANANALANANAGANANALANANTNANGMDANHLVDPFTNVILPAEFSATEVGAILLAKGLGEARLKSLFKRVIGDSESLIRSQKIGDSELRVAQYLFRGTAFEVEAAISDNEINIVNTRLLWTA